MALALFVPPAAACHFRRILPDEEVWSARSWCDLQALVSDSRVIAAVIDPGADGKMDLDVVIRLIRSRPGLAVFAYVPPTPWHLKAIFKLSQHGLKDVFLHPIVARDPRLARTLKGVGTKSLAYDFLSLLETRLATLPPELYKAVQDLFERPHLYLGAADIAIQAGVPVKKLYRRFESSHIGTPNKLITAAKVLRGYSAMRSTPSTMRGVSLTAGFEHPRQLSARTATIFGCSPKRLRSEANAEEVILQLVEWLYRPTHRAS